MTFDEWWAKEGPWGCEDYVVAQTTWEAVIEACAGVCESMGAQGVANANDSYKEGRIMGCFVCATAIRAQAEEQASAQSSATVPSRTPSK